MIIYKTINLVNGKFYIGKDVKDDASYLGSGRILKQAIKKYGKHNFRKEILEVCFTLDELDKREKYWISYHNATKEGYNLTSGGTGGDTWTNNNLETHWNIGRTPWNKGKTGIYSDETISKMSDSKKVFFTNNPDKKINSGSFKDGENHKLFGVKQSNKTVNKRVNKLISNGTYEKTKERMKSNSYAKQRPIKQFDLNGNLINEYTSIAEASSGTGIPRHRIQFVLRKKQKQTGGYIFEYA
jgi:group I intron endonuclease